MLKAVWEFVVRIIRWKKGLRQNGSFSKGNLECH